MASAAGGDQRTLCHRACSAGLPARPIGPLSPALGSLRLGGRPTIREGTGRKVAVFLVGRPATPLAAPFGGWSGAARSGGNVRARRRITGIPGRGRVARSVLRVDRGVPRIGG